MKIYIHKIKWDKDTKIKIVDDGKNDLIIKEDVMVVDLIEDITPSLIKKMNEELKKHNLEVMTDKDGNPMTIDKDHFRIIEK